MHHRSQPFDGTLEIVSLLHRVGHKLLFRALRANDVISVGDESFADHRRFAGRAHKASVVPVATLERDEAGPANPYIQFYHSKCHC